MNSTTTPRARGCRTARAATGTLLALGVVAGGLTVTQTAWGSALAMARLPVHEPTRVVTVPDRAPTPARTPGPAAAPATRCSVRVLRHTHTTTWGWASCRSERAGSATTWNTPVRIEDGHLVPVSLDDLPWDLRALAHRCPSAIVPAAPRLTQQPHVLAAPAGRR